MILGFCFTSCKEDTQPRLDKPTEFRLNTPPMAGQLYVLSSETPVNFTVSQANYGLATTPNYSVEISDTEDFAKFVACEYTTTDAKISVPGEQFSLAICSLFGYTDTENFSDAVRPIYVRVRSVVPNCEYSDIVSNVICLKQVKPYLAIKVADTIWLVGDCEGWSAAPNDEWALVETAPESRVYKGTFDIAAGKFQFRFYDKFDADEPWDWYSIGSQNDDAGVEISSLFNADGLYEGNVVYNFEEKKTGKGSWLYTGWPGGKVDMTVNLNSNKVSFQIVK